MNDRIYLLLEPDVEQLLSDNGVAIEDLLKKSGLEQNLIHAEDPATKASGHKDAATIILASAAAIAAATPILRELIRTVTGRASVIRQRRLVQVTDSGGEPLVGSDGKPALEWEDCERAIGDKIDIGFLGLKISFESL